MRRRNWVLGVGRAGGVGLSALLLVVAIGSCSGNDTSGITQSSPSGARLCRQDPQCVIPDLTEDQINQAWSLIENDPLNQLLHLKGAPKVVYDPLSHMPHVDGTTKADAVGPWIDSDNSLIGVAANFTFPPQTIEADWPNFKNDDPQRVVVREHHKLTNLETIGVMVDLQNQRVAKVIFVQYEGGGYD